MENLSNLKLLLSCDENDEKISINLFIDELKASVNNSDSNVNLSKITNCMKYLNEICDICLEDKLVGLSCSKKREINLILAEVISILRRMTGEVSDNRTNAMFIVNNLTEEQNKFINLLVNLFITNVDTVYNSLNDISTDRFVDEIQATIVLRLLQFFANLVNLYCMHCSVYNKLSTSDFKNKYFKRIFDSKYLNFFTSLYNCEKCTTKTNGLLQKSCYAYTAILYNCINDNQILQNVIFIEEPLNSDVAFWRQLLDHVKYEFSEWSLWIIFIGLKRDDFFKFLYVNTSHKTRCVLFDVLFEFIEDECKRQAQTLTSKQISDNMPADFASINKLQYKVLSDCCVRFLFDLFKKEISSILQNESIALIESDKIAVIRKLSSLLVSISSMEIYKHHIHDDKILLEILVNLINTIQILAKNNSDSMFEVKGKLKDIDQNPEEVNNPFYGFKRDIIGLIGNVIYQDHNAQEYLRKSNGLAALLDCARLDVNNPFIMQWSIFAIRNALERNCENQQYVAQLHKHEIIADDLVAQIQS